MAPQIYLITPADPDLVEFPRRLMAVLAGPEVAAILVQRGTLGAEDYARLSECVVQIGQAAGAAVLVEDDVELSRRVGADGVHIGAGGTKAIRAAVDSLKPDGIVGAGAVQSRHDAMSFGELDVDYLFFGPLDGAPDGQADEFAQWWAETFEIPAVHSDPSAQPGQLAATGAEFIALSDSVWSAADPAAALAALAAAARESA